MVPRMHCVLNDGLRAPQAIEWHEIASVEKQVQSTSGRSLYFMTVPYLK
jgi:hypothetical protein